MARILLTLDEPLATPDGRMAGLGVRVHEMAGALARRHPNLCTEIALFSAVPRREA